jgi:hypothetical protein
MWRKAKANIAAARMLAERGWYDGAANRAYFALFQAGVGWMAQMGKTPDQFSRGATRWRHAVIVDNASLYRRRMQDVLLFRGVRDQRVQADYDSAAV